MDSGEIIRCNEEQVKNPFQHIPKKIDKYYVIIADPKCGFIVKMIQENNFPAEFTFEEAIRECNIHRKNNICASYIPVP